MKKIGLFFNPYIKDFDKIFSILEKQLTKNIEFYGMNKQNGFVPNFVQKKYQKTTGIEAMLVFGGDGTILRAIHQSLDYDIPLVGINLGNLGFLTDIQLEEFSSFINILLKKEYKIQKRMLLKVSLKRDKQIIQESICLNDVVIDRGSVPKLITVDFSANERFVLETRCDGILASTPTGSTAYSLAAGGPILSPDLEAIIVNPLNPHILSVRPMVFNANDVLIFKIKDIKAHPCLQIDGISLEELKEGDEVIVTSCQKKLQFIKLIDRDFFKILRTKLHMGRK